MRFEVSWICPTAATSRKMWFSIDPVEEFQRWLRSFGLKEAQITPDTIGRYWFQDPSLKKNQESLENYSNFSKFDIFGYNSLKFPLIIIRDLWLSSDPRHLNPIWTATEGHLNVGVLVIWILLRMSDADSGKFFLYFLLLLSKAS